MLVRSFGSVCIVLMRSWTPSQPPFRDGMGGRVSVEATSLNIALGAALKYYYSFPTRTHFDEAWLRIILIIIIILHISQFER